MKFSIVIPTHQRRELVSRNVGALEGQTERDFEAIVVVDGSTDGTARSLRQLDLPFPLTVVEQANLGAGAARNAGAAAASGDVLVFLDDDMEADPRLLVEHERSRDEGADVVLGDLPLHPASPRNLLSWGVGQWAHERSERLSQPGAEIGLGDLLTGQISISRDEFERLGGFDSAFTREGLFGGEDVDFCYRVLQSGLRIVFNPAAVSRQYYDVDPGQYLRRAREAGRSGQELALKYPEPAGKFGRIQGFHRRRDRWVFGPFVRAPDAFCAPLRAGAAALARTGHTGERLRRLFFLVRTVERLRGARMAKEANATGRAVVLAYHAIADLGADPVLGRYAVPPRLFAEQLDWFASRGWSFVGLEELLGAIAGEGTLPPKALVVTFDDAYTDLAHVALPLLSSRGIPAIAFAVAAHVGGTNEWDRDLGAAPIGLLGPEGLLEAARDGIEIGSHGDHHRSLAALEGSELAAEVEGSAERLEAMGLPRPRALSYPYGECTPAAKEAVRDAGFRAAFTVTPGVVERGADRFELPRVQVNAEDTPARLRLKVATARMPARWRKRLLRWAPLGR